MKLRRSHVVLGLLGLVLGLVAVACGADATATPTPGPTATATPVPTPTATLAPGATPLPTATATPRPPTPTPEPSFDAEAYFKGKTIRLMVGFGQGGGTDAQARYMASKWPPFIPGNPRFVVTNLTPVETERNFVWSSEPDGFIISVEATPGIFDEFETSAKFKMDEVSFIGSTSGKDSFWAIWAAALPNYDCISSAFGASDLITTADTVPSARDIGSNSFRASMLADMFDVPLKIFAVATTGTGSQLLMLERGDINSWISSTVWYQMHLRRAGWLRDGILEPFADLSFTGWTLGPNTGENVEFNCPHVDTLMDDDQKALWRRYADIQTIFSKNIIGPPGMDPNVLGVLRKALDDAMNDKEFADGLEKFSGIPNNYTPGDVGKAKLDELVVNFRENQTEYNQLRDKYFNKYIK